MAAAAGSAPAPVGFKGRRASVTPRRSESGRRPRGRTVRLLRVMQACSLAHSPTKSRRMDLHHRCPGGGAFTARCIATLPRLGKWICHGDVRPAAPDTNGVRRFLRLGRVWGFLSESHRPHAAYDAAASTARPRNRKMWTAPDVRRVLPIKSRVHRCLCLRSERCGRRDLHAHATVGSEF